MPSAFCYDFFFFQAEDGIRDIGVTGVQTCALPILTLERAGPDACHTGGTRVWHAVAAHRSPHRSAGALPPSPFARPRVRRVAMAEKSRPSTGTTDGGTPADVAARGNRPRRSEGPRVRPSNGLDRYFGISARRSTVSRELARARTAWFTMADFVELNPARLSVAAGTAPTLPFASIAAVTTLVAGVRTSLMGVVGRYPFAVAAGLRIYAIVAVL